MAMNLDDIARRQHGVVSARQATEAGLSRSALAWRVTSKRWRSMGQGLYQAHMAEPNWWARASAAVLRGGQGSALYGPSAAYVHGLVDRPPPMVSVAVPADRHPQKLVGVRFRRRTRLVVVRRRGLPVTSAAQTAIDLAGESVTWQDAVSECARVIRARRATAEELLAELGSRAKHPHRRALRQALDVMAAGADTLAEIDYVRRVERRHGLPSARLQVVADGNGSTVRRDAQYDEWGLIVEIDGSVHQEPRRRLADMARDRVAAGLGWATLRFANVEIIADSCRVAADVLRVLRARGFRGQVHGCGPRCPLTPLAKAA